MFTRIATLISLALLLTGPAHAAANWQAFSFAAEPQNVPKLIAAIEKFMATEAGKEMPGTMSLMASVIDGADPSTHSIITSTDSLAARETWLQKHQPGAAWTELVNSFVALTDLGSTSRMIFQKTWGDGGEGDVVWHLYALDVSDPAAYSKALDKLMASATGKQFPGSLWLSSIAAAGMGSASHVLSVGYASEAEAEKWNATMLPSADWAAFDKATDGISNLAGSFVLRSIKTWGTPTAP